MNKILKVVLAFVLLTASATSMLACSNECSHDWVETNRVEGTCALEGKIDYKCSKCEQTKSENTGFGEHAGNVVFDGTHHWKENTCEHGGATEKVAHDLKDGVCECGFCDIGKAIIDYNGLAVLQDGVDFVVTVTRNKNLTVINCKDEVVKFDFGYNSFRYIIRDGELDHVYDFTKWTKHNTSIFGSKLSKFLIATSGIEDVIGEDGEGYTLVERGEWRKIVGENKVIVETKDGRVAKIEVYKVTKEEPYIVYEIQYGNADVGEVPEIPENN